jgi:hypothetical protein
VAQREQTERQEQKGQEDHVTSRQYEDEDGNTEPDC